MSFKCEKIIIFQYSIFVPMKILFFQILECGGNLFDAVSLAVKAALHNTMIPNVETIAMDGGNVDLQLSGDPYDCWRMNTKNIPCLVTITKVCVNLIG